MFINKFLFKNTLLARSFLRQTKQVQKASLLNISMQMRYLSTKSKTESAFKSERFNQKFKEEQTKKKSSKEEAPVGESTSQTEDKEIKDPEILKLESRIKELERISLEKETKLNKTEKQLKEVINKYRYQVADNDNTVKRYKVEVSKARSFAITKFAQDLLNVRDDFQRALNFAGKFDVEGCEDLDI